MSEKYPEHKKGEHIPYNMRICNVVICRDNGEEFLLGSKLYSGRRLMLRPNPTLIPKGRITE